MMLYIIFILLSSILMSTGVKLGVSAIFKEFYLLGRDAV
jgi:hypothetical protein